MVGLADMRLEQCGDMLMIVSSLTSLRWRPLKNVRRNEVGFGGGALAPVCKRRKNLWQIGRFDWLATQ